VPTSGGLAAAGKKSSGMSDKTVRRLEQIVEKLKGDFVEMDAQQSALDKKVPPPSYLRPVSGLNLVSASCTSSNPASCTQKKTEKRTGKKMRPGIVEIK
jgi:hypothetical protein